MNPKRSTEQIVMGVFGFVMLAFSSPCVIAMISDIITQADNLKGALIAGGFMSFIALAGMIMMYFGLRTPRAKEMKVGQSIERQVLAVARARQGRVTVSELALETEFTIDECREILLHFEMREIARTHLSSAGDIVYVFPHFDGSVDKAAAIDPLNDEMVFDAELEEGQEDQVVMSQPEEAQQEDW